MLYSGDARYPVCIRNGDWEWLAQRLTERLRPTKAIEPELVRAVCKRVKTSRFDPWSEGSWLTWFKIQLINHGCVFGCGSTVPQEIYMSATLHIFFTSLEETEEMQARLRNERRDEPAPKRSKLRYTTQVLEPIDRVAARVVSA